MFTLVGFYDATQHDALAAVNGMADPHVRVSGDDIYVPSLNKLLGVFAGGISMIECRLQSPSLRRMVNQRITPVYPEALPCGSWYGAGAHFHKLMPRVLDFAEALNAFAKNAGGNDEYVFVWLMDKLDSLPAGELVTIESTLSVTDVVGAWVNGALTFTQTLPAGRYAVAGMRITGGSPVAARLVFPDTSPRPGCMGSQHYYELDIPETRYGNLGSWGEFEHDAPPTCDVAGKGAGALVHYVYLDLVQVRAGRR